MNKSDRRGEPCLAFGGAALPHPIATRAGRLSFVAACLAASMLQPCPGNAGGSGDRNPAQYDRHEF